jgi:hypothetical protein
MDATPPIAGPQPGIGRKRRRPGSSREQRWGIDSARDARELSVAMEGELLSGRSTTPRDVDPIWIATFRGRWLARAEALAGAGRLVRCEDRSLLKMIFNFIKVLTRSRSLQQATRSASQEDPSAARGANAPL